MPALAYILFDIIPIGCQQEFNRRARWRPRYIKIDAFLFTQKISWCKSVLVPPQDGSIVKNNKRISQQKINRQPNSMSRNFYNLLKLVEFFEAWCFLPRTWNNGVLECWNVDCARGFHI